MVPVPSSLPSDNCDDGLQQDYYCHADSSGDLDVGLSDGSSFTVSDWGPACGQSADSLSAADFNGDGKTDFLCKHNSGGG